MYTKFQGHQPFGSREDDFLMFLPYVGMSAILVMWPGPLEQTFVPPSHRSSIWNLTSTGPVVSEEKMFKECGWWWRRMTMTEAYLSYKLTKWAFGSGELKRGITQHWQVLRKRKKIWVRLPYNGIFSRRQIFAVLSKTWGFFFADFKFRGGQHPWKTILILFRENRGGGGITWFSLDRQTVWEENLRPKYLKRMEIKDICNLTDKKQKKNKKTKRTYLHTDGWIKLLFRAKQCLILELWKLCHTTLFAIKQLVAYSECNIIANILFNKETKTITCISNTTTKEN